MDPDETHRRMLALAASVIEAADSDHHTGDLIDEASELADAILALDGWIRSGGFLPDAWRKVRRA